MFHIKKARESAGLTQEQLANKVNVTKEYISYIENGHKTPSIALLQKIAKVLNTTIRDLIEENTA
jgi:transcriptional regulator with XRE-family HTH domain